MTQVGLENIQMTPICREYLIERHNISIAVKLSEGAKLEGATEGVKVEAGVCKGRKKITLTWEEWQTLLECYEMTNTAKQLLLGTLGAH